MTSFQAIPCDVNLSLERESGSAPSTIPLKPGVPKTLVTFFPIPVVCDSFRSHDDVSIPRRVSEGDVIQELMERPVRHGLPKSLSAFKVFLGLYVQAITDVVCSNVSPSVCLIQSGWPGCLSLYL